ncbi:glutathione S-transferase C-terminal domain-containing protein homolog [Contarinia nasturtii]|uniref:glutathione S-transferase C-terminal domain-containing protein homolog n=1 Tax=Contarinia nasturtii TaxID=265458 RepID=UPI0012D43900|nr:glutathione S-transferase C-terminal domain-containing protein homolog [Contarinia nasturtii]
MCSKLYLETFSDTCDETTINVTLETSIVLFVLKFVGQPSNVEVFLVPNVDDKRTDEAIKINRKSFESTILAANTFALDVASNCSFPVIVSENVVISGLSSVCRAIIKHSDDKFKYLLGFKEGCLQAPSEASPWTKFCEVDIAQATKTVLQIHKQLKSSDSEYILPNQFAYFESHLTRPVKAHNIRKLTMDLAHELKVNSESISDTPKQRKTSKNDIMTKNITLEHKFVEGPQISIADLILFPYFWLMQSILERKTSENLAQKIPLTYKWIETVKNHPQIRDCMVLLIEPTIPQPHQHINYIIQGLGESFTLYKRDSKQNRQRTYTRDENIEQSLKKINQLDIEISSRSKDENVDDYCDWLLPYDALPEGGNLPENRLQRKKEQLFSLAREIIAIAKIGDRIVDFCSGQGHLAIILAYKLPQCMVYMLDNKEEMIVRARKRVQRLNLTNIRFFQCNLDYFVGDFDIGTSLHACGIASDIVLMHCRQRNANFVCCPCCYGKVIEMPHISFPRSKFFRSNNISLDEYLCIAHCADQAHDMKNNKNNVAKSIQGQYCMDIIDTDRKLYMEECGYHTKLTKLQPEDCTPKNRLLIGIKHSQ